jgi:hypothetical protein
MTRLFASTVIFPAIIFLLVLGILIPMLPPGLTFVDCGQLCTAAWGLGIAHPSGYPLWCLWAHLGMGLSNGLDATLWGALASALVLALTAVVLARLGMRLGRGWGWSEAWSAMLGAGGALAAVATRIVLDQGTIAEVYALNLFMLAMLLSIALEPQKNLHSLLLFAFIAGLGLSNHSSLLLPLIPLSIAMLLRTPSPRNLPRVVIAFLLGLSVWLYLPLRAHATPIIAWGWPDSWNRFWEHVLRSSYGGMRTERLDYLFLHLGRMFAVIPQLTGWFLLPFPLLGMILLWLKERRVAWIMLWVLLLTGPLAAFLLTMMLQPHQVGEFLIWLAPFYLLLGLTAGWGIVIGVWWLCRRYSSCLIEVVAGIFAAALISSPFIFNLPQVDKSGYFYAEDYGHNLLSTISYHGAYLVETRSSLGTFETAFLVKVRQLRPDILFMDTSATVFTNRSDYEKYASLPSKEKDSWRKDTELRALYSGLVCFYSYFSRLPEMKGFAMIYDGMLYRAIPPQKIAADDAAPYDYYCLRGLDRLPADDEWATIAAVRYRTNLGVILWRQGRHVEGQALLEEARCIAAGETWSLALIGEAWVYLGQWGKVAELYGEAIDALPPEMRSSREFAWDIAGMYLNLAIAREQTGDKAGANEALGMVRKIYPQMLR